MYAPGADGLHPPALELKGRYFRGGRSARLELLLIAIGAIKKQARTFYTRHTHTNARARAREGGDSQGGETYKAEINP